MPDTALQIIHTGPNPQQVAIADLTLAQRPDAVGAQAQDGNGVPIEGVALIETNGGNGARAVGIRFFTADDPLAGMVDGDVLP